MPAAQCGRDSDRRQMRSRVLWLAQAACELSNKKITPPEAASGGESDGEEVMSLLSAMQLVKASSKSSGVQLGVSVSKVGGKLALISGI